MSQVLVCKCFIWMINYSMRHIERVDGLSCVVYEGVPQDIVDLVESRFPGMGQEVSLRPHLPLEHCQVVSEIAGSFNHVQIMVGAVSLDIFPTLADAKRALEEQLKKYQHLILLKVPAVATVPANIMMEVRGMMENMFGLGGELACQFVYREMGNSHRAVLSGFRFVCGDDKFPLGKTVERAAEAVRKAYAENLKLFTEPNERTV